MKVILKALHCMNGTIYVIWCKYSMTPLHLHRSLVYSINWRKKHFVIHLWNPYFYLTSHYMPNWCTDRLGGNSKLHVPKKIEKIIYTNSSTSRLFIPRFSCIVHITQFSSLVLLSSDSYHSTSVKKKNSTWKT